MPSTHTDRPHIVQYWDDEDIPAEIEDLFESHREHNPDMQHTVFSAKTARAFLEDHFTSREVAAFDTCAVPAMQADYFRYCAIYQLGGVYSDADCECKGPLMWLLDAEGELFKGSSGTVTNGVFGFREPGHQVAKFAYELATRAIEQRLCEHVGLLTGPIIFTTLDKMAQGYLKTYRRQIKGALRKNGYAVDDEIWDGYRESIMDVTGGRVAVSEAFDGVRISPNERMAKSIDHHSQSLGYRDAPTNYPNWEGSIYR